MSKKILSIAVTLCWAAIVFYLHVVSIDLPKESSFFTIPNLDKAVHFLMFCALAFLLARTVEIYTSQRITIAQQALVFLFCSFYGALMEYLQSVFQNQRTSDIMDWMADLTGSFIGILLASLPILTFIFQPKSGK